MRDASDMASFCRPRRMAVLVRAHRPGAKAADLLRQLRQVPGIDVFLCADCTAGPLRIGDAPVLAHDLARFRAMGLEVDFPNPLWTCGDYPFFAAAEDAPGHDFFLMMEFDVALGAGGRAWLGQLAARVADPAQPLPDFFAPRIDWSYPGWYWAEHARLVGGFTGAVRRAFFPVIGLSRAAIARLLARRREESRPERVQRRRALDPSGFGVAFCEYFVPSVLAEAPEALLASSETLGLEAATPHFTVHLPLLHGVHDPAALPGPLVHPVLDLPDYLGKTAYFASRLDSPADWQRLSEIILALPPEVAAEPVIAGIRADPRFGAAR